MKTIARQIPILLIMLIIAFTTGGINSATSHAAEADQPLKDGYYVISTALDDSKVLDIDAAKTTDGANVQLWGNANVGQQRFKVTYLGNGSYKITAFHSDKALDVKYGDKKSGTNLQQYQWNNTAAQQWIIKSAGDGYYYIQSKLGTYVDCVNAKSSNGTNVHMYEFNGTKAQKWKFTRHDDALFISGEVANINCRPVSNKVRVKASGGCKLQTNVNWITAASYDNTYVSFKTNENFGGAREGKIKVICGDTSQMIYVRQRAYEQPLSNGMFKIATALNNVQVLDIASASKDGGANVHLWQYVNANQQKFNLTYLGDGYYKITNENSGLSLDVAGGSAKVEANLQQYNNNGTHAQQWRLEFINNDTFYIKSRLGTYIDCKWAGTGNGTNIWMQPLNGSNAQKWIFSKTQRTPDPVKPAAPTKGQVQQKMIDYLYNGAGGKMSCDFDGYVNTKGIHEGIDFKRGNNANVHALIDGKVIRVANSSSSKTLSTVSIYDSKNDKSVIYLHAASINVKEGQTVRRGQHIAKESNRGAGPVHTHVEVRNGYQKSAAKSVNDYKRDNPNPYPYWQKVLF